MKIAWRASVVDPPADGAQPQGEFWSPVRLPGVPVTFADADHLAYRTTFEDPRDDPSEEIYLTIHGCPGPFALWVNGSLHDRVRFPINPRTRQLSVDEGLNEVVLLCGRPKHRFGGIYDTDQLPAERTVPAPWWDLSFQLIDEVTLLSSNVTPRIKGDTGIVTTEVSIVSPHGYDGTLTTTVRPEGINASGAQTEEHITLTAGEQHTIETTVSVPQIERWHPRPDFHRGLYRVTVSLEEQERTSLIGFRSLSLNEDTLFVNSRRVPIRGFTIRPGDDPSVAVERAVGANANTIRPMTHVPHVELYEQCLSAGLLVWQDMPLVGPGEVPRGDGLALAGELTTYLRDKPALGIIAMHEDPFGTVTKATGAGYLGNLKMKWRTYRESQDEETIDAIASVLDELAPTIPAIGGPGVESPAGSFYPGVYHGSIDSVDERMEKLSASFIAATGAPAASIPRGRVPDPWRSILASEGVESSHASRTHQRDVCKRVIETARLRGLSGTLVHTMFDIERNGGFGILTSQDERKPAFNAVKESFEPVQTMLDPPFATDRPMVVLVNDTGGRVVATVTVKAGPERYEFNASAPAYGMRELDRVQIPAGITSIQLVTDYENKRITNTYDIDS